MENEDKNTKRYMLEIGQFLPQRREYSYGRLAVNVMYLWDFKQDSLSDSVEALKERYERVFKRHGCHARITDRNTDEVVFETKSRFSY